MSNILIEISFSGIILTVGLLDFLKSRKINFLDFSSVRLSIWMSSLTFGFGPWLAYIYSDGKFESVDFDLLLKTYFSFFLFIFGLKTVLYFSGQKIKPFKIFSEKQNFYQQISYDFSNLKFSKILFIYLIVLFVRGNLALNYGIFFSGSASEEKILNLPYWLVIGNSFSLTMAYSCVFWAALIFWKNNNAKYFSILILFVELLFAFTQGRRSILFFSIIILLSFWMARQKQKLHNFIYAFALILILNNLIFPLFLKIRNVYNFNGNNGFVELVESFSQLEFDNQNEREQVYRENMAMRPLTINRFNCEILEAERTFPPMYGKALGNSLEWILPALVFPGKYNLIQPEQYVEGYFGLTSEDVGSNWPAYGEADWGIGGAYLVGVFLGLILKLFDSFAEQLIKKATYLSLFSFSSGIFLAMQVEETPIFTFVLIRNLIILLLMEKFLLLFSQKKSTFK